MSIQDIPADRRAAPKDTEGAEQARAQAQAKRDAQARELSEAEALKEEIMAARDPTKQIVTVNHDGYEMDFRALSGKERRFLTREPVKFLGAERDDIANDPEQRDALLNLEERMLELVTEKSVAEAFDRDFWEDYFESEEWAAILGEVANEQSGGGEGNPQQN